MLKNKENLNILILERELDNSLDAGKKFFNELRNGRLLVHNSWNIS